jgi:phosphoglycolate phosphatase
MGRPFRVVFWDIDGTLVAARAGGAAMLAAMHTTYGRRPYSREGVRLGGRCDSQIALEVASRAGVPIDEFHERFDHFHREYAKELRQRSDGVRPLDGAKRLLEHVEESLPDVCNALITGNLEQIAQAKLELAGLAKPPRFEVAAYGSERTERHLLASLALDRARTALGEVNLHPSQSESRKN